MKIFNKIFLLLVAASVLSSCEEDDVFVGSPVGTNVQFETLQGIITTPETHVASSQVIDITVTIPQSFSVETKVQAQAFIPQINKRTIKTVLIPAGATSATSTMTMPGGDNSDLPFHSTVELSLIAIATGDDVLPSGFSGKQYSLTSDKVVLDFGDGTLPASNNARFVVKFDFELPPNGTRPGTNNVNLVFKKNGVASTIPQNATQSNGTVNPIFGTLVSGTTRYKQISFVNALAADGTYTLEAYATRLIETPASDIDYRFLARFPDDVSKVYPGTLTGLTVTPASGSVAVLKIVKSTVGGVAHYDVTQL
ncbi:MAG TPA: hypothetical protein VK476_05190 [Flavobacterium sp.]|nr:hypothetical protein [Flavobacterium sp.]